MPSLLWIFWLCHGTSAVRQAVVDEQEKGSGQTAWGNVAFSSAAFLILLLGVKWFSKGPSSEEEEETKVTDCNAHPVCATCAPRRGCAVIPSLESLGQMEQELVTLLYKVRKHKIALAAGWLSEDQADGMAEGALPNDLVIYTIQEET